MDEEIKNTIDNEDLQNAKTRGLIIGLVIGLVFMGIIFLTVELVQHMTSNSSGNVLSDADVKKIKEISNVINKNFYSYSDETTTDNITEGIFRGMLESLNDDYSEYYSVEELRAVLDDSEGVSYGIGCYVSIDKEYNMPVIAGVFEGSSAEEAGILEGDIIYEVDGESTMDLSLTQVVSMIKGLENTTVNITMLRDGEYIDFEVVRKSQIEDNNVDYGTIIDNEDIGYIYLKEFDDATTEQFKDALEDLRSQDIKGLIIDLRSNPGGNLTSVVDIAREILPAGLIVYTEDKNGNRTEYTCDGENALDIPLVVLTNGYTASAAEILAGAVQDYNIGTLIGTTTFGKGIVQRIITLSDGSAVKLTISAYFTPSGRNIQSTGIEPDIVLEYDSEMAQNDGVDNQVEKAKEILLQKMGNN